MVNWLVICSRRKLTLDGEDFNANFIRLVDQCSAGKLLLEQILVYLP